MALTIDTKNLSTETLVELKRATLNDNVAYLCHYLDYKHHYISLRDQEVLTKRDDEEIQAKVTTEDKIYEMVMKLTRSHPNAFNVLCRSIMKSNQQFVVEKLFREYQAKINAKSINQVLYEDSDDDIPELDTTTLPRPGDPGTPALPSSTSA